MNCKILLVDDEENVLSALKRALIEEPYEVYGATSGEQALEVMQAHCFKVVMSDERMTGMQGSEFLSLVRERYPDTVRILLTGHATLDAALRAVNQGEIYRFFTKPWDDTEIKLAVRLAIEKYDLERENRRLLSTIKRQTLEMKVLERRFPGITRVGRDSQGSLVLDDMPEEEIRRLINMCEQEIEEELEGSHGVNV
ncbi:MAG: response regulator [Oryzomonas sp.]|uniref:response regulator n=1 Tax=Oryzomonas sp. TaxID=2855186 RepID=UPI0028445639|nr:response regulator [Oryzomonas sp.]MDR3579558.1 response regulator [Oryzomonas sp.]